jgi:transcriptional regulator with XRE-family HTH domain
VVVAMSVVLHSERLRLEMARRGWDAVGLAREARISQATVSTALAGRPISAKSLSLIAQALLRVPASAVIDSLLRGGGHDIG